ncbi:MAG: LacI family DNA-binding transcriptional regulator [Eubacteriales bacterium]|nr:LacI family DNA-binding transcriptional regulator [Eubacteriales bacterium]
MKVSIKQIAELTGFSPATVSNALNYKRGVNKDTAARVFAVARELGYIEENRITRVRFVVYKKTGLILDDTPFFPMMMDGAEREARNCSLEMSVTMIDRRMPGYEEQIRQIVHDKTTAVILLGTELADEDLKPFEQALAPVLVLDYWPSDMRFDGVLINNADSARMAVTYLLEKGHRQIGYLRGNVRIKAFRSRAVGYQVALSKAGLVPDKKYAYTLSTTMDGAYRDMLRLLSGRVKTKEDLPTAFFADDDMIAFGAMKALEEKGYRIPEDISIIGFDDLPYCEIVSPRLTTLRVSKQEMGAVAVNRLKQIIMNPSAAHLKIQVCTELIERDSVVSRL